ncbi:ABC transporter permease [Sciscionella sediminilitoris]|uniref:ABC transporter permease n=1 Tax=Sciscionella sediminilitoris TaxID=1445613 RepID=UPI0009EB98F7|nr:ABC transporter permease [Sciscionella sp. SE31]
MTAGTLPALPALPPAPLATATEVLAVTGRRLRHLVRGPGRLVGLVMNPLVMMIGIGYLFRGALVLPGSQDYVGYLMAGACAQLGLAGIGPTAVAVAMDLRGGLVDRFRSLPISRAAVLLGHTLADLVASLAGLVLILAVGFGLGWRVHTGFWSFLAGFGLLAVFCYVLLWVGVLVGMIVRSPESIDSIGSLIVVLFGFLSSAFLAVGALPGWLAPIAAWNPVSAIADLVRGLWGNPVPPGAGFASAHPGQVLVIALGVIFCCTASISLRRYARR